MNRRRALVVAALVVLLSLADIAAPTNAVAASQRSIQTAAPAVDDEALLETIQNKWYDDDAPKLWIKVGLADVLARQIVRAKGQPAPRALAPNPTDAAAISLEGWSETVDPADAPSHRYAAATTDWMMQEIVDEVGIDAMRRVITSMIIDCTTAYGVTAKQLGGLAFGNEQLLDLLEYDARSTKARQLFEKYVFFPGPSTDQYLAARPAARVRYEALAAAAGEWKIPFAVRGYLASWSFAAAMERMTPAEAIVRARDEIARLAAQSGALPSPLLQSRFEGAQYELDDVARLASDELATARAIAAADARLGGGRGLLERIGLLSETPEAKLEQAKAQFTVEGLDVANARLLDLDHELDGARSRGIERILMVLVPLLSLCAIAAWVQRRRQREREADAQRARLQLYLSAYGRSQGSGFGRDEDEGR